MILDIKIVILIILNILYLNLEKDLLLGNLI